MKVFGFNNPLVQEKQLSVNSIKNTSNTKKQEVKISTPQKLNIKDFDDVKEKLLLESEEDFSVEKIEELRAELDNQKANSKAIAEAIINEFKNNDWRRRL